MIAEHAWLKEICKSENTLSAATEDGWISKMSVKALAQVSIEDQG